MRQALFIALLFLFHSCEKKEFSSSLVLARVKEKELSIEQLEKELKPNQRSSNQIKSYINDWVNETILFEEAKKLIPGGVNSPVRAFKSVGGTPIFIKKAIKSIRNP